LGSFSVPLLFGALSQFNFSKSIFLIGSLIWGCYRVLGAFRFLKFLWAIVNLYPLKRFLIRDLISGIYGRKKANQIVNRKEFFAYFFFQLGHRSVGQ